MNLLKNAHATEYIPDENCDDEYHITDDDLAMTVS